MKSLTFGEKIAIIIVFVALIVMLPFIYLALSSIEKSDASLKKQAFNQLNSIREIKKKNMEK